MNRSRIRSFVRRQGRVTVRQQRALETLWDSYVVELTDRLTLPDIFSKGPVTLEIGFGMGASLAEMAAQEPMMNFLGVEVHRPGVGSLLAEINERKLANVRIICADIIDVLHNIIPHHSLDRILIFFPDPWHKKRHHKRRLIQEDFVKQLRLRLKAEGILHMATDWQNYAQQMQQVVQTVGGFKRLSADTDPRPATKFEKRGANLGHQIHDLIWQVSCC